jgi:hypothetical protein
MILDARAIVTVPKLKLAATQPASTLALKEIHVPEPHNVQLLVTEPFVHVRQDSSVIHSLIATVNLNQW